MKKLGLGHLTKDMSPLFKDATGTSAQFADLKGKTFITGIILHPMFYQYGVIESNNNNNQHVNSKYGSGVAIKFSDTKDGEVSIYLIDSKYAKANPGKNATQAQQDAFEQSEYLAISNAKPLTRLLTAAGPSAYYIYTAAKQGQSSRLEHLKLLSKQTLSDGRLAIEIVFNKLAGNSVTKDSPYPVNYNYFSRLVEMKTTDLKAGTKLVQADLDAFAEPSQSKPGSIYNDEKKKVLVLKNHKGLPNQQHNPYAYLFQSQGDKTKTACTDYSFTAQDKISRVTYNGDTHKNVYFDLYYNKTDNAICEELDFGASSSAQKGSDNISFQIK